MALCAGHRRGGTRYIVAIDIWRAPVLLDQRHFRIHHAFSGHRTGPGSSVFRLAGYADHAFNRCPACTAFPVAVDCGDCDSWAGPDEYDVCDCIGRPAGLCAAGARLRARRAAKGICDCIARCGRGHPTADVFTSAAQLRRAVDRAGDARLFNRRSGCGRVGFSWHRRAAAARRVGLMLASARDYMDNAWWIVTMPGIAILVTVLSINVLGDALRDALDPKLKRIQ